MTPSLWNQDASPYHRGERELHERIGLRERQEAIGRRMHRPVLPTQHRDFYELLPFLLVGSDDDQGQPWASILFGLPGFVSAPSERLLHVEARALEGDPLGENLRSGAPLGALGIELPTRRRNRVNGVIAEAFDGVFEIDVVQAYGNCPQYIQTRGMEFVRDPRDVLPGRVEPFEALDEPLQELVRQADTFFVASSNPEEDPRASGGVDVSHRGGMPGFVHVEGNVLTVPDFSGNNAFNTLGNFLVNPRAGLLFIDFASGDLVQMAGRVELLWEPTPWTEAFEGAQRAWRFTLERGHRLLGASPLRWSFGDYSPRSEATGTWADAERRLSEQS